MDYKNKYLKYKNKYLNLKLKGGSYTIEDKAKIEIKSDINKIYTFKDKLILSVDENIGSGGSGFVSIGEILDCPLNQSLKGKKVAVKFFKQKNDLDLQTYEKNIMRQFKLDKDGEIVENEYIAPLYFDIKNTNTNERFLVYEYGGHTLHSYYHSEFYNMKNNIRLLKQFFIVLRNLAENNDNIHNDIKNDNMVYTIDSDGLINLKLIDFGSSKSINELQDNKDSFQRRTNMITPETNVNHLKTNGFEFTETVNIDRMNNFKRWYYYPYISILCFLLTGEEYTTGDSRIINTFPNNKEKEELYIKRKESTNFHTINKVEVFPKLLDNQLLKDYISTNIKIELYDKYKTLIEKLIDGMCKLYPDERLEENKVIEILDELDLL